MLQYFFRRIHSFDYNFTVVFGTPKKITASYFKKLAYRAILSAAFHENTYVIFYVTVIVFKLS